MENLPIINSLYPLKFLNRDYLISVEPKGEKSYLITWFQLYGKLGHEVYSKVLFERLKREEKSYTYWDRKSLTIKIIIK